MQVSVYIILLQNSLQVSQSVKYLPCNLHVWENAFVPIVLQSVGREEEPLAYFSPCEIEFSPPNRGRCVCAVVRTRFVRFLMPEMSCFISGVSLLIVSYSIVHFI